MSWYLYQVFVQSNSRTVPHNDTVVVDWFPYNRWVAVTVTYSVGEQAAWLTHDPDFLWYMNLAQNTAGPRFKLSVFVKLGLNITKTNKVAEEKIATYSATPVCPGTTYGANKKKEFGLISIL